MRPLRSWVLAIVVAMASASAAGAQAPVAYRLSFPEREHHLMQVDITFPDVPTGPLQLRMSRSLPGRYALHEFAKNVFDLRSRRSIRKASSFADHAAERDSGT